MVLEVRSDLLIACVGVVGHSCVVVVGLTDFGEVKFRPKSGTDSSSPDKGADILMSSPQSTSRNVDPLDEDDAEDNKYQVTACSIVLFVVHPNYWDEIWWFCRLNVWLHKQ